MSVSRLLSSFKLLQCRVAKAKYALSTCQLIVAERQGRARLVGSKRPDATRQHLGIRHV